MGAFSYGIPSQALPPNAFDGVIRAFGVYVLWQKSHNCPCTGLDTGPNAKCNVCFGRGVYWDDPIGPFIVLMSFVSYIGRNVNTGVDTDREFGYMMHGDPMLTIPPSQTPLWQEASLDDIFIELQSNMRFNDTLRVGYSNVLINPYSVTIAPTNAVVVQDPTINQPVSGVPYIVSGGVSITLDSQSYTVFSPISTTSVILSGAGTTYPEGTPYSIEYLAAPRYVAFEQGGLPHVRPLVQGQIYPRRFRLRLLGLWLRNKTGSSDNLSQNV